MATIMTLRKLNATRKLIDKELLRLNNDIHTNRTVMVGYYNASKKYIGITPIEDFVKNCTAIWQQFNDLLIRRNYLNEMTLCFYGGLSNTPDAGNPLAVKVHKFIGFDKKSNEFEYLTIAQAISRKKWFENSVYTFLRTMLAQVDHIEKTFEKAQEKAKIDLKNQINSQFGPESSQTAKQRTEYEESIKENYEIKLIDPIDIKPKLNDAIKFVEEYLNNIDSVISKATEMTEVEVAD